MVKKDTLYILERKQLLEKVGMVQGLNKKSYMQILSNFLLTLEDGRSSIYATDLETSLRIPLTGVDVEKPFTGCIHAKKFYEILRELEGEVIYLSPDGEYLRIISGKTTFRLAYQKADEYPLLDEDNFRYEFALKSDHLRTILEKTLYAVASNNIRPSLNTVLFHISPDGMNVVGTDGYRMTVFRETLNTQFDEEVKLLVPRKAAFEIKKILPDEPSEIKIFAGDNRIKVQTEEFILVALSPQDSYPPYEDVIPYNNRKIAVADREALLKVLKRVSVIARGGNVPAVRLQFQKNTLKVSASSAEIEGSDSLEIEYTGEDFEITFNPDYLLDGINAMEADRVTIKMEENNSATLIHGEGAENYLYVVMPIKTT
jgi:DNA polymerase-3 subunit beta